jgi:hypothetical protein
MTAGKVLQLANTFLRTGGLLFLVVSSTNVIISIVFSILILRSSRCLVFKTRVTWILTDSKESSLQLVSTR